MGSRTLSPEEERIFSSTPTALELRLLSGIVCLAILARIAAVSFLDVAVESDFRQYHLMATNLLENDKLMDGSGNLAFYNAGYALFVLVPTYATFGPSPYAAQIVNSLLGGASVFLSYCIARQAGARALGRLLAAFFFAFYVPALAYAEYLAKENFMTPLLLAAVYSILRLRDRGTIAVAATCGAVFGLLAMVGNSALSLGLAYWIALATAPVGGPRKLALALATVVTAVVVVSPWIGRNYLVLGAPILNANGGRNLYIGNNPSANGMFVSIARTPRGPSWEELRRRGEVEADATLGREAREWIAAHPEAFLRLALAKAALFWTPPFHRGDERVQALERLARRLWVVQYLFLTFWALAGVFMSRLRTVPISIVWSSVSAYWLVHLLYYIIFRYREPIMPLVGVLAALAIEMVAWTLFVRRETSSIPPSGPARPGDESRRVSSAR